jgi:ribonucleoside-diphosphate reductase alpha chain
VKDNHNFFANKILIHNCFEVAFQPVTPDGRCGVQVCNLTTTNGGKVKTEQDFYDAVKSAAIIGTLQAAYTTFPYLSNASVELTEKEALLGVSITGVMENPKVLLDPNIQTKAANIVKDVNAD